MKSDIVKPVVKNVTVVVARHLAVGESDDWKVYLINNNEFSITNTLVSSKGYGQKDGVDQETSVLRHFLETVPALSSALIEPIAPEVFHLNNEYWVSYYIGNEIYDKRFVFVPDSIRNENLTFIKQLNVEGILHS